MPFYSEGEYNKVKGDLDEIIYTIQMYFKEDELKTYWNLPGDVHYMVKEVLEKLGEVD